VQVKKPKAKSTATAGNKKQKKQKMGQDASWDNGNGELRFGFSESSCPNWELASRTLEGSKATSAERLSRLILMQKWQKWALNRG
jgi:hypothetical protein